MSIVESLYVPDNCIQGEGFPAHIIYTKKVDVEIRVNFSDCVNVDDVFNVSESDYELKPNELYIKKVEVRGYVGILFKTKKSENHSLREKIKFLIKYDGSNEEVIKEIYLFRPDIRLYGKPERVIIEDVDGEVSIKDKIVIGNEGQGTGFLAVKVDEKSEVKKKRPEGEKEFGERFMKDLEIGLTDVSKEFPWGEPLLVYNQLSNTTI